MKKILTPALSLCLLCLAACHKDHVSNPGSPTDSTGLGTFKLDLISSEIDWADTAKSNVELIISEPGGKVLLDTITPANTHISTSLNTDAATVDVTNIYYNSFGNDIVVNTYKGVNPSTWSADYSLGLYAPPGPRPATIATDTALFINSPNGSYTIFGNNPFSGYDISSPTYNTILVIYPMLPNNYGYLVWTTLGRYKFFLPSGTSDTIDCSNTNMTTSASFTPSSYYSYTSSEIFGYTDSTNLNSKLLLYYTDSGFAGLPQLEYPAQNIQKYAVVGYFGNNNGESAQAYTYGNTVNTNITYPDPASYTISANQNTHFAVNWNATKPTYYGTIWSNSAINYTLYASPDSATLNPIGLLTTQNAKMLQGQDLTKLTLNQFFFADVQGYNYAGYLGLANDSTQLWKNPVSSNVSYFKTF